MCRGVKFSERHRAKQAQRKFCLLADARPPRGLREIVNTSEGGDHSTKFRNRHPSGSDLPLTQRELDVLTYLPTRLSTIEIATKLHISPNTVKTHLKSIYHKLEARSRNEAIVHAIQRHLISDSAAEVLMLQGNYAAEPEHRP
jgi:DNA-binding CsgD family transcriptional regulator